MGSECSSSPRPDRFADPCVPRPRPCSYNPNATEEELGGFSSDEEDNTAEGHDYMNQEAVTLNDINGCQVKRVLEHAAACRAAGREHCIASTSQPQTSPLCSDQCVWGGRGACAIAAGALWPSTHCTPPRSRAPPFPS